MKDLNFIKGAGAVIGMITVLGIGFKAGYKKGRSDEKSKASVECLSFVTDLKLQLATLLYESSKKQKSAEQTEEAKENN
jgi:hypothetical protein